ncbi:MAG TPA: hypothetical protein VFV81_06105 [Verrucomicrobiae bacterium]|nr:hypothetical protein [Verrucomicrobiae bacterium]
MKRFIIIAVSLLALAAAPATHAVITEKVDHDTFAEWSDGELDNVALGSDGVLQLAPAITNLADVTDPIIWAAVQDDKGTLYLGTGNQGKIYKLGRDGKLSVFFAPNEMMVHALALDAKNRLYAATSPNGRVYRLDADGHAEVFCSPGETYIWAMTFGKDGALYLATGDKGKILRVPAGGSAPAKAETWLETPEANITCLAWDNGHLLAGTSPHGYLYRVDGQTNGFVLFNSGDTEIRQIAAADDGAIFVSTFSGKSGAEKTPASSTSSSIIILSAGMSDTATATNSAGGKPFDEAAVPGESRPGSKTAGAAETAGTAQGAIYRVETNGYAERYWSAPGEAIYSMILLPDGDLLAGTGNKGRIYSISGPMHWKLLQRTSDGAQVAALLPARGDGQYIVATSHPGKLYRIDFALAARGTYLSKIFDAGQKSSWGKMHPDGALPSDGRLEFSTRSGNTEKPEKTWSEWSAPASLTNEIAIASPPARYLQYRISFERGQTESARVRRVLFYYQNQNAAPVITRVRVFAQNFGISKMPVPVPGELPVNLEQLLGSGTPGPDPGQLAALHPPLRMIKAPGLCTVAWTANDPNQDQLVYSVAIRAESETNWTTLADETRDNFFSFDSTGFREGRYFVRVLASDRRSNTPETARTAKEISPAFLIDNTPPTLTAREQTVEKRKARFLVDAVDGASVITSASYSLDGKDDVNLRPVDLIFDSTRETFSVELEDLEKGAHGLLLRVQDEAKNTSVLKLNFEVR